MERMEYAFDIITKHVSSVLCTVSIEDDCSDFTCLALCYAFQKCYNPSFVQNPVA